MEPGYFPDRRFASPVSVAELRVRSQVSDGFVRTTFLELLLADTWSRQQPKRHPRPRIR